jgi:hypothetical protein
MPASVERIRPSSPDTDASSPLVKFATDRSLSSLILASSLEIAEGFADEERDLDAFSAGGLRAIGCPDSRIVNAGGVALYVPAV